MSELPPQSTTARVDGIAAICWIVLGAVVVWNTSSLPYLSRLGPGPGFFPYWIGMVLIALGALLLAGSFFNKEASDHSWPSLRAAFDMAVLVVILAGFAFAVERVGFTICVGLTFFLYILLIERASVVKAAAIAAVSAFLFWAAFVWLLEMQLPSGFLNI